MSPGTKPWMAPLLYGAAAYNLSWGAFIIAAPAMLFRWAGMPPPNYPEIWQCLGMVVGVYGVGYAIAARDPLRHWPIILVGLLGKVFGPMGMLYATWHGALPWRAAWLNVPNDLIWWLPFGLILRAAWVKSSQQQRPTPEV